MAVSQIPQEKGEEQIAVRLTGKTPTHDLAVNPIDDSIVGLKPGEAQNCVRGGRRKNQKIKNGRLSQWLPDTKMLRGLV